MLIQPSGQTVLEQLGLLEQIKLLASPVVQLHGISVGKNRRALDMRYAHTSKGTTALGIHRASLFSTLLDAVRQAGIQIVVNSKLINVVETTDAIAPVFEEGGKTQSFDCLVDASGARSPLAAGRVKRLDYGAFWATVDIPEQHDILPAALDQRYYRASQMAGIMPIGLNPATGNAGAAIFWSEKPENAKNLLAAGIDKFCKNYCALWPEAQPFVSQLQSVEELNLAVYHHRTGDAVSSDRLFHVGDSWHCTSPQLGQGANMALIDAAALADAFGRSSALSDVGKKYRKARMFHIGFYQMLSIIFTPLYQSDGFVKPWIRDMVIQHFARWPIIRNLIAKTVSGTIGLQLSERRF